MRRVASFSKKRILGGIRRYWGLLLCMNEANARTGLLPFKKEQVFSAQVAASLS
jgi:hypothetical protein